MSFGKFTQAGVTPDGSCVDGRSAYRNMFGYARFPDHAACDIAARARSQCQSVLTFSKVMVMMPPFCTIPSHSVKCSRVYIGAIRRRLAHYMCCWCCCKLTLDLAPVGSYLDFQGNSYDGKCSFFGLSDGSAVSCRYRLLLSRFVAVLMTELLVFQTGSSTCIVD